MRLRGACLLLVLMVLMTGCFDRREAEDLGFVLALGIDKGERSAYAVTFMIALPAKLAGGDNGGGEGKPFFHTTVEAPTLAAAMGMVNNYVDRRVTLIHTKGIFLGEELARKDAMLPMDEFVRFREVRRSAFCMVTAGKASEFLRQMEPEMEKDPSKFIEQMTQGQRYTGMLPTSSEINDFISSVTTQYRSPVTYFAALAEEKKESAKEGAAREQAGKEAMFRAGNLPREGGPNIEMVGAAAFSGGTLQGVLTGEETRLMLMLQDEFVRAYFSIEDPLEPGKYVSLDVRKGRPRQIAMDLSGERPQVRVQITLEAELLAIQGKSDYTEPQLQRILEEALAKDLVQNAHRLVHKTQGWNADVAGFGQYAVRHFGTVDDWHRYDWPARYRDAHIDLQVRVTLRRFGLQLSPPTLHK